MEFKPINPFEPISCSAPPAGGQWTAQIKWDGVRMLHYYDGRDTRLFNRKTNERTEQYPEFLNTSSFCKARSVILDGEFIAFDRSKPSFHEIMRRDSLKQPQKIKLSIGQVPVTYMIFDILLYNGEWVTGEPLERRQRLLEEIILPGTNVQLVQNFSDGDALFDLMKQHQMEGVVYKDLTSAYGVGVKDGRWRKRKVFNDLIGVVGGVTYRDKTVNSLLVGLYTAEGDFLYIGHAGTGKLTRQDWARITELVPALATDTKPFANEPERSKDAYWLRPELTVKVEYLEMTPGGTMRHPSIQAFVRADKHECTVSQLAKP